MELFGPAICSQVVRTQEIMAHKPKTNNPGNKKKARDGEHSRSNNDKQNGDHSEDRQVLRTEIDVDRIVTAARASQLGANLKRRAPVSGNIGHGRFVVVGPTMC